MRNEFDVALNHLKQAEAISPNSYMVHNAIGRNFMKKAASLNTFVEAEPFLEEGKSILKGLINSRDTQGARGYSIHSLISEHIKIAFKFNKTIPTDEYEKFKNLATDLSSRDNNDPMIKHLRTVMNRYEVRFLKKKYDWSELDLIKSLISQDEINEILDS